jgi:hypothetical protein
MIFFCSAASQNDSGNNPHLSTNEIAALIPTADKRAAKPIDA